MGLADLFRPKWRHSEEYVRLQAVRQISDSVLLTKIVVSDSSPMVQQSACERINDPKLLLEIVTHPNVNYVVGASAVRRLSDETDLLDVATSPSISSDLAYLAAGRLSSGATLATLLRTATDRGIRIVAIQRLAEINDAEGLSTLTPLIALDDDVGAAALYAAFTLDGDVTRLWRPFSVGSPESPLHLTAASIMGKLTRKTTPSDASETLARLAAENVDALIAEPNRAALLAAALNRIEQPTPSQQELYRRVEDFKGMHRAGPIGAGYALVGDADIYDATELAALHDAQRAYWECESGTQTAQLAADLQALQERLDAKYRGVREAREREARAQAQARGVEEKQTEATQLLSKLEEASAPASVDIWLPSALVLLLSVQGLSPNLAAAARAQLTRRARS